MPVQARCPKCPQMLAIPESLLGKPVRCPGCQTTFTVAAPTPAVTSTPPQPAPPPKPPTAPPPAPPKKQDTSPNDFSWEPSAPKGVTSPPPAPKPPQAVTSRPNDAKESAAGDFDADFGPREERRPSRAAPGDGFEPWDFKATVSKDPEKRLKGFLECRVTENGLTIKQGDKLDVRLSVPAKVKYGEGNKLTVEIEGRDVDLAVTSFNLFQTRLARELARFLTGKGPPPTLQGCKIPPFLHVIAFLPIGIPILSLGGAIWGALGGGLVTACFAIVRRDQWPVITRVAASVGLSVVGYAILLIAFLETRGGKGKGGNNPPDGRGHELPKEARHTDPPQPGELRRLNADGEAVWHATFSPDSTRLATLGDSGLCELWEVDIGNRSGNFRAGEKSYISGMTYSPVPGKHRIIGWGGGGQQMFLRDTRSGDIVGRFDLDRPIDIYCTAEFFPDGNRVFLCGGSVYGFYSVPECRPVAGYEHIKPTGVSNFFSACITPDGSTLLTGSVEPGGQRYDEVWDLTKPSPPRRLTKFNPNFARDRMTLSPKGDLAMVWNQLFVELVDWKRNELVLTREAPPRAEFTGAAISMRGDLLITGHTDSHVRFWAIPSGRERGKFKIGSKANEEITGIAVSPDGRYMTTARKEVVTTWETSKVYPK